MSPIPPNGVVDGPFIKFEGWDLPGHDVARHPQLEIAQLKNIVLDKHGFQYYAFNTGGWIKSLAVIGPSQFAAAPGSTLYVRVQFPGWDFIRGKNVLNSLTDH